MIQSNVERLKLSHALTCLGLGAVAGFIAGWANTAYGGLAVPLYFIRPTLFTIVLVSLVAPVVEESIKPLGLYFLKEEEKTVLRLGDWALLGAFAGLGFALLENGLYALEVSTHGAGIVATLLGLRTLLCIPIHMTATTITGFGVGVWARTGRAGYFLRFLVLAMLVHGLYNFTMTVVG
jgi:RsiW-degrading membrane proteinase PrsW (M82 family)